MAFFMPKNERYAYRDTNSYIPILKPMAFLCIRYRGKPFISIVERNEKLYTAKYVASTSLYKILVVVDLCSQYRTTLHVS